MNSMDPCVCVVCVCIHISNTMLKVFELYLNLKYEFFYF